MPTLFSIAYSPWSERARFALDVAGISYEKRTYIPMLGEPALRWALGRPTGRVTVPVLVRPGHPPLDDSFDIALWAAVEGRTGLVPEGSLESIRSWAAVADRALEAGRILTTRAVMAHDEALWESLPPPIRALGPVGMAIGRRVAAQTVTKYPVEAGEDPEALVAVLRGVLDEVRAGLDGRDHLLDTFTLADIWVSVGLSFVQPPPGNALKLGDHSQRCWTRDALVASHGDVLAWRDGIYARYR